MPCRRAKGGRACVFASEIVARSHSQDITVMMSLSHDRMHTGTYSRIAHTLPESLWLFRLIICFLQCNASGRSKFCDSDLLPVPVIRVASFHGGALACVSGHYQWALRSHMKRLTKRTSRNAALFHTTIASYYLSRKHPSYYCRIYLPIA